MLFYLKKKLYFSKSIRVAVKRDAAWDSANRKSLSSAAGTSFGDVSRARVPIRFLRKRANERRCDDAAPATMPNRNAPRWLRAACNLRMPTMRGAARRTKALTFRRRSTTPK